MLYTLDLMSQHRPMGRVQHDGDAGGNYGGIVTSTMPSDTPGAHHKVNIYGVGGRDAEAFTTGIFETGAVCSLIESATGHRGTPGCQDAAAFTQWTIDGVHGWQAYNAAGHKQAFGATVHVATTLPKYTGKSADATDGADIRRFLSRLAHHERGHGATGERTLQAMQAFVARLPNTVPSGDVAQYNVIMPKVLNAFETLGRKADVAYDLYTGHGLTQGAVAPEGVVADDDAAAETSTSITSTALLF